MEKQFYAVMLENARRIIAGYRRLLDGAVAAGVLVPCDTARLARAIDAMAGGSLIGWVVYREGAAEAWVRHDLSTAAANARSRRLWWNTSPATSRSIATADRCGTSSGRRAPEGRRQLA